MRRIILISAFAVVLAAAAVSVNAFIKGTTQSKKDSDGHVLTALWQEYDAAVSADRPKKEEEVLSKIREQARAQRLHWDFYDASIKYADAASSRNWKLRRALNDSLKHDIELYDEPVVTYSYRRQNDAEGLTDYVLASKARLQAGRNSEFYSSLNLDGTMTSVIRDRIRDDYEYALWCQACCYGNSADKAAEAALKETVAGRYPEEAYLEYKETGRNRTSDEEKSALRAFCRKYEGKAIRLLAEDNLLRKEKDSLSLHNGKSAEYKALLAKCQAAEKERSGYKSGIDSKIAGTKDDFSFDSMCKMLQSKDAAAYVKEDSICVLTRNLSSVVVSMTHSGKDEKSFFSKTVQNKVQSFYVLDTLKTALPAIDDGDYVITVRSGKVENQSQYSPKSLSIAARDDSESLKFFVADSRSGEPAANVSLELFRSGESVAKAEGIAMDGFTAVPESIVKAGKADASSYMVASYRDSAGRLHMSDELYMEHHSAPRGDKFKESGFCSILTDKGAYNPGETLKFKAILYKGNAQSGFSVIPEGTSVKVSLLNADGKAVSDASMVTNGFGSVAGEFSIPEGGKNGKFTLLVESSDVRSRKRIDVDEFILPSYSLEFDKDDRLYLPGDTVHVTGKVVSYSGHPLSSAKVTYTLSQNIYQTARTTKTESSSVRLDADGKFDIVFFSSEASSEYVVISVKVSDGTGETQEYSRSFLLRESLRLDVSLDNKAEAKVSQTGRTYKSYDVLAGEKAAVTFTARNANGDAVSVPVNYEITSPDGRVLYKGTAESGKKNEFTLPQTGSYSIRCDATAVSGERKSETATSTLSVIRIDENDTSLDTDLENLFCPVGSCADGKLRNGEHVKVKAGSCNGPVWMVVELFGDHRQLLEKRIIHLEGQRGRTGSLADIDFEYKSEYPDVLVLQVLYFHNEKAYTYNKQFSREREICSLPLSFSSFTDQALPGTHCTMTLKSEAGVEAVAAVFDKSSETIASNRWPSVRLTDKYAELVRLSLASGTSGSSVPYMSDGYDGPAKGVRLVGYKSGIKVRGAMLSMRSNAVAANAMDDSVEEVVEEEAIPFQLAAEAAPSEEYDVPVRTDFSTSLAFEPFLYPDKDGNITLDFTASDKLSTFIVQAFAHDKDMRNAVIRKEMVVTIPVKVSAVEPKYLYKGDRYVLQATVSNSSEEPVEGTIALNAYSSSDYRNSKPFTSQSRKVTVPAGGSAAATFDIDPKKCDTLGLKLVFADKAAKFSDGTFVTLPVMKSEQTITESHSAVLLSGADKAKALRQLQSEFTGIDARGAESGEIDIRQMLLDAIPSKVDPDGKDILSLTEAWYVRKVAAKLGSKIESTIPDEELYSKIIACRNADGGFGWFEGMKSSPVITAVVLERFAKLRDAGLLAESFDPSQTIAYLDRSQFIHGSSFPFWCGWLSADKYIFVRSMYASIPFDVTRAGVDEKSQYKDNFKSFKEYVSGYLLPSSKDGRGLNGQILSKARRLSTLANLVNNEGGLNLASKWGLKLSVASRMNKSIAADAVSLLEYAVKHVDGGWYYPDAVMPWRGLLESELYAHATLCDLLSDSRLVSEYASAEKTLSGSAPSAATVSDGIRLWMMLQKETQKWGDDPAYVDAISSVMSGPESVLDTKVLTLTKTYSKPFSEIASAGNGFTVERHFYRIGADSNGKTTREEIKEGTPLNVGDRIRAEYSIWSQENRSFVKLTAPREAAFRPVDQISGYYGWWLNPLRLDGAYSVTPQGYRDVKSDRTEYWFDVYPEENTTVSEDFYATQKGIFSAPVVTIESTYAPHYRANDSFKSPVSVR